MLGAKDGYDLEARVAQITAARDGMTRDQAIDGIVADAVPAFLSDEANVRDLVGKHRTLAEKIRDFIGEFAAEIKRVLARLGKQAGRYGTDALSGDAEALTAIYGINTYDGAQGPEVDDWEEDTDEPGIHSGPFLA